MKTTLLGLCLFLFSCRAISIEDTDGQPVRNGGTYYLIPISNKLGGGLGLAAVGSDEFPQTVVQDTNLTNGLPVRFASPLRIAIISSTMFLDIGFVSSPQEIARWNVDEEFPIGWTVKVSQTVFLSIGRFKVEPTRKGYKIVYYRQEGETGADLGIVRKGGYYRLIVKDGDPFVFKFKKATKRSALMSII